VVFQERPSGWDTNEVKKGLRQRSGVSATCIRTPTISWCLGTGSGLFKMTATGGRRPGQHNTLLGRTVWDKRGSTRLWFRPKTTAADGGTGRRFSRRESNATFDFMAGEAAGAYVAEAGLPAVMCAIWFSGSRALCW